MFNGPVKAAIRKKRCEQLMGYMQAWRALYDTESKKPPAVRKFIPYNPPKPAQAEGIKIVIAALNKMNTSTTFKESLRRTFVTVGQAPDPIAMPYTFVPYPGHDLMKKLARRKLPTAADTLGDMLAQLSFIERDADVDDELAALAV